ncbi:MAG: protein kinase [Polyangiales bacterium]
MSTDDEAKPEETPMDALQEGADFGPFEIVREVGRGAFGVVYEARRRPLHRRVALKVLHPHVLAKPEARRRFERELAAAAAVEHPNVIAVLDGGVLDGRGYMAMNFLEGEALSERLKARGALPVEEAVDALLPITAALHAVHLAGIVHRDIKPANVFLARAANGGDSPVLLDFGVAKELDDAASDLTQSQSWLGTPTYMSPEQIRQSKDVTARSDQWSFGVVLYECLVGERPFEADVLLDLMKAITADTPPSPNAKRPSVPSELSDVVMRALSRDPSARFSSMLALGEALLPFASEQVRAWWRPRFSGARARGRSALDETAVREPGDARAAVPGRIPDPEGALPTLMANQPAISAPPLPLEKPGAGRRRSGFPSGAGRSPYSTGAGRNPMATGNGRGSDRTVIVSAPPRSASETLLRYVGVAAIAGFAFFAGRNISQPPGAVTPPSELPSDPTAPLDASTPPLPSPAAAVDATAAPDAHDAHDAPEVSAADAPDVRVAAPSRPSAPSRPRNGSIQILCGTGRAIIGDDDHSREVGLPTAQLIPWPAGYVRVMILSTRGQSQSYITVRSGQTTAFQDCPGL